MDVLPPPAQHAEAAEPVQSKEKPLKKRNRTTANNGEGGKEAKRLAVCARGRGSRLMNMATSN